MIQMQRRLGLVDSVFIGLGSILGAGVFVVTGLALEVAGPAMLVGFLLAGIGAFMNALSVAQLARVYPLSGGTYVYAGQVLNPWAGFAAGWMFLVSKLAAGAVVALSFAAYLRSLIPGVPALAAALGLIFLLTLLNLWGIKKASWFNLLVVSVTLSVLGLVVVTGIGRIEREYFTPFAPQGLGGILQAGALLFFAYTGYARIATLGEEVVNPRVTIPRAIVLALGGAGALYLLISTVLVGTVRPPLEAGGLWLSVQGMPWLSFLVSLAAITAMVSVLLGQIMGISRMFYALARGGDLPGFLGALGAAEVPQVAVAVTGLVIAALTVVGGLTAVVSMASFAILLYYTLANLSALGLPQQDRLYPRAVSWLGLFICLTLALSLALEIILMGLVVLGLGLGYRFIWQRMMVA